MPLKKSRWVEETEVSARPLPRLANGAEAFVASPARILQGSLLPALAQPVDQPKYPAAMRVGLMLGVPVILWSAILHTLGVF